MQNTSSRYYQTLRQSGADWYPTKSTRQNIQIVARTPDESYNALTHNIEATGSGYFSVSDAYNNIFPTDGQCGYDFVNRGCDGDLLVNSRSHQSK